MFTVGDKVVFSEEGLEDFHYRDIIFRIIAIDLEQLYPFELEFVNIEDTDDGELGLGGVKASEIELIYEHTKSSRVCFSTWIEKEIA